MTRGGQAAAWLAAALAVGALASGCGDEPSAAGAPSGAMILASTSSTADTGLLGALVPAFEARTECSVKTVAVGSGQAIELGERDQADALLVHSPAAESEFIRHGFASSRRAVMENDFVLVGPPSDPADLAAAAGAADALARIARGEAPFASRADESGTHTKELAIWERAGVVPRGDWYIQTGQGMAQTLRIASERRAYALSDSATLVTTQRLDLEVLVEGDESLANPYTVIVVEGDEINTGCALAFSDYVTGAEGQELIGDFGVERFGMQLFVPTAGAG